MQHVCSCLMWFCCEARAWVYLGIAGVGFTEKIHSVPEVYPSVYPSVYPMCTEQVLRAKLTC
jgi:hypothetical protein